MEFPIAAFVVSQLLSGHRLSPLLNLGSSRVRTRFAEKERSHCAAAADTSDSAQCGIACLVENPQCTCISILMFIAILIITLILVSAHPQTANPNS